MGNAKAKGAGAGALAGAGAGSAFGPIGAGVGAVAGGALGWFGSEEPPEYQQPAADPALAQLMMDQAKARLVAVGDDVRRSTGSFAARYGVGPGGGAGGAALGSPATPTSMDPSSVLARYGAMLAKAG